MTDNLRSVREHLTTPALYCEDGAPVPGSAWRDALLARYPLRAASRRPVSRAEELRQLLLLVALPVALATAVAIWAMLGLPLPAVVLSGEPATAKLLGDYARYLPPAPLLWLGLGFLSTALTFAIRGRIPRFLPLDW